MSKNTLPLLPEILIVEGAKPSARVIRLGGVTRLDLDPDMILENNKGQLKSVVLIGYDHDDNVITVSSVADGGTVLWLAEILKQRLLGGSYD